MRRILLAGALALALAPAPAGATMTRRQWVSGVAAHTTLTRAQARWVWYHRPRWRDEYPVRHSWTSTATKLPSPAVVTDAAAGTNWCRITTTEKYRAPLFPFGDQVLFSFEMERTYAYDGATVTAGTLFFDADTTKWGWRWTFDGVLNQPQGYLDDRRFTHRTDAYSAWSTEGIHVLRLGAVRSTLHTKIVFSADGDWSTMNTEGEPGCRN